MSRSKRDILETESMLTRLTNLLVEHANRQADSYWTGRARGDAESLRRISLTLHRWHELECGDSNAWNSFCLVRGKKTTAQVVCADSNGLKVKQTSFEHDDAGKPYLEIHHNSGGVSYSSLPDRELGARKRLAKILSRYPGLTAYVQTDPRGAALYILRADDVPAGASIDSCYNRGIAVFK